MARLSNGSERERLSADGDALDRSWAAAAHERYAPIAILQALITIFLNCVGLLLKEMCSQRPTAKRMHAKLKQLRRCNLGVRDEFALKIFSEELEWTSSPKAAPNGMISSAADSGRKALEAALTSPRNSSIGVTVLSDEQVNEAERIKNEAFSRPARLQS